MWSLNDYKRVFIVVGVIGIILLMIPTIVSLVSFPSGEQFSELYILGQNGMAEDYPFNVSQGNNYLVNLGVGNHMGTSMYYGVEVKLRNSTDASPNGTEESHLPLLYQYRVFLEDGQNWTEPLNFSFTNVTFQGNSCSVGGMQINAGSYVLNKSTVWDSENDGFYYQLLVELWAYNQTFNELLYDGRYVGLWLNMT